LLLAKSFVYNIGRKLLNDFSSIMYDITRYDRYEIIDTLKYTDNRTGSSIVSSIEFDRDEEYFAVGGVTKDIKIFDFGMTRLNTSMIHCPLRVMTCSHKISCLSWSPYIKSQIASSDYEGFIDVWDTATGQKTIRFEEHKRRAWSVDICQQNPTLLASGSDDTTVKVWSLASQQSIHTLEQKGNVCCAKFAPNNSHYLAVGSAGKKKRK
jgi:E3 ubiquitin-protein ligase RFWD2